MFVISLQQWYYLPLLITVFLHSSMLLSSFLPEENQPKSWLYKVFFFFSFSFSICHEAELCFWIGDSRKSVFFHENSDRNLNHYFFCFNPINIFTDLNRQGCLFYVLWKYKDEFFKMIMPLRYSQLNNKD